MKLQQLRYFQCLAHYLHYRKASETIIAAKNNDKEELVGEISDLLFHTFVLMNDRGVSLDDIENKLKERHQVTGNKKEFHTRGDY